MMQEIKYMLKFSIGTSLAVATVAAALAATPGFAAQRHMQAAGSYTAGSNAYAAAPASSPVVIVDGRVVGADPDPSIRLQLLKDADAANN
jgi:hypothetical protein